jgi:transcriptional adapter 2-alpha
LECFAIGSESFIHRRFHSFVVADLSAPPFFSEDWTIQEEMLLLEAVSHFGFGNWNDISDFLASKSARECEAHYTRTYLEVPSAPIPRFELTESPLVPEQAPFEVKPTDLLPSEGHRQILSGRQKRRATNPAEHYGFMPMRHEFEKPYHEDAENMISGLEFDESEDTMQSLNAKLELLSCYSAQVEERSIRTKLVEELGLLYEPERETEIPDEITSMVRPLTPFLGAHQAEEFAKLIHEEAILAEKLSQREYWRFHGVTTIAEGELFQKLQTHLKSGSLPSESVPLWDQAIQEYRDGVQQHRDVLSAKEVELCDRTTIDSSLYLAIKDLLIREFVARGRLSKVMVAAFDPEHRAEIEIIYDHMVRMGWIHE